MIATLAIDRACLNPAYIIRKKQLDNCLLAQFRHSSENPSKLPLHFRFVVAYGHDSLEKTPFLLVEPPQAARRVAAICSPTVKIT